MSKKPRGLPPLASDTTTMVPKLPDANALRDCGLPLSPQEFDYVRAAMGLMAVARQPKLTWKGWKIVGGALGLGEHYAAKAAGKPEGRGYNARIGPFLRSTGFGFLNAGVRWAARQCALNFEAIDAWREGLSKDRQAHLHNPIDIWKEFEERDTATAERPELKHKRPKGTKAERARADLVDYVVALEEQRDRLQEQVDMLNEVIRDLGGDPQAARRTELRPEPEEESPTQRPDPMFE